MQGETIYLAYYVASKCKQTTKAWLYIYKLVSATTTYNTLKKEQDHNMFNLDSAVTCGLICLTLSLTVSLTRFSSSGEKS